MSETNTDKAKDSCSASKSVEEEAESFLQNLNVIVVDRDVTLDPKEYRNHYENLLSALKHAKSCEAALHDQSRELRRQLQVAASSSQDAKSQMDDLQSDLETVKSLLESANDREDRARVSVSKLQEELERLTDLVDRGEIESARKTSETAQLKNDVDEWKNQASIAAEKISTMEIELQKKNSQVEQLQLTYVEERKKQMSLKENLSEKDVEIKQLNERRDRVQKELEDNQAKLETKTNQCIDDQYTLQMVQSKVASLEKQLKEGNKAIAEKEQELKEEGARMSAVTTSLHQQKEKNALVGSQLAGVQLEAKKAAVELNRLMLDKTQLERNYASVKAASLRHQQGVLDAQAATRVSNDEAQLLKRELDEMRKREDQFNRNLLIMKRENAVATGRIKLTEDKVKKSGQDLQHNEQLIASLEKALAEAHGATTRQEIASRRLEAECDGLRQSTKDSRAVCQRLMDDVKMAEDRAQDLSKAAEELQSQSEAANKQHDATRVELNNSLKDLAAAQRETKELEQDRKSAQRLIDALRSELSTKDSALAKENHDCRREKAQKRRYADEISLLKKANAAHETTIQTQQTDLSRLGATIRKAEDTLSNQKREYDHVINERDILGTQLLRRNDELALLYEKIKILQSTQRRGELQYNERLDDIRLLKIRVRDLQRQLAISQGDQAGVNSLSRNLTLAQKELTREKLKVKALCDEMENPINVHRWRKLEGTDPAAYDMIEKMQMLHKRLLSKSEEVVQKNSLIQEHEKRHKDMEKDLARRPGHDAAKQINAYQHDIRKKSKQMKAMSSELNMQQAQVSG